jgi:hypothetical protein
VPTLNKVPLHPRGDGYSPCVLIRAGGVLDGVMALLTVAVIGSHACCERIVVWNVWRLVSGTTAKVHVTAPVVVGSPSRSIVSVPLHVPVRNDCGPDGLVGPVVPPSQPTTPTAANSHDSLNMRALIPRLLRE